MALSSQTMNEHDTATKDLTILSTVGRGFMVNIANPKTVEYYASIFAVLIPVEATSTVFIEIVTTAVLVSSFWWTIVAMMFSARTVRRVLASVRRYIELVSVR